ncbi:MAG: hypothetical protein HY879_15885 [Deltaproteobacteria bacterium]|nr:hypothetical protein [Deltaproteobacteria bacterium]
MKEEVVMEVKETEPVPISIIEAERDGREEGFLEDEPVGRLHRASIPQEKRLQK